jgi:anti-anti-sigma regulatory factor
MGLAKNVAGDTVTLFTGTVLMSGVPAFRAFEETLQTLARQQQKQVVIDFQECIYIDSRAIALIISANRRFRLSGTQLKIINANREITGLLCTMQVNRIIEIT